MPRPPMPGGGPRPGGPRGSIGGMPPGTALLAAIILSTIGAAATAASKQLSGVADATRPRVTPPSLIYAIQVEGVYASGSAALRLHVSKPVCS